MNDIATIIYEVIQQQRALHPDRAPLIGVAGAQGSGKTTACKLLEAANRPRFAYFSLDDVYYTQAERHQYAKDFHDGIWNDGEFRYVPWWAPRLREQDIYDAWFAILDHFPVRGPPGTHDLALANGLVARLSKGLPTPLPRFDKAKDDRAPEDTWPIYDGKAEAILIDGWCLGATRPKLDAPINEMEHEDAQGFWRNQVAWALENTYPPFFAAFDAIVYLKPPSWEIVRAWRGQQEEELLGRALTPEEGKSLDRFLMFYERVTRHMMAGGHKAHVVVELDDARNVVSRTLL